MSRNTSRTRAGSTPLMIDDDELDSSNEGPDLYSINQAFDYTCSRLELINSSSDVTQYMFCGQCDRCQINSYLKECKQWFERASHLTIKNFILELIKTIKVKSIYNHLNNLLKISIDSKDFIYSRNKMIPSIQDDHMIVSNDRCSNLNAIDDSIRSVLKWYRSANYNIKLNFVVSLLKECEQSIISIALFQIKTILEAPRTISAMMNDRSYSPVNFITPSVTKVTPHSTATSSINKDQNLLRTSNNNSRNNVMFSVASDYDDEIVNDNTDDDSFNGDFDISALYTNVRVLRKAKYIDFIRQLPVYLSKMILSRLNKKTLHSCLLVSKYWYTLVKETHKNDNLNQILMDDMLLLRGTTSKICNPKYANDTDVKVPNLISGTFNVILNENEEEYNQKTKADFTWENAYKGVSTRKVILEERNVYCGSYNVLLLKDKRDSHRVVCLNGDTTVVTASFDKKIRFIDIKTAEDKPLTIQGHAGSIKCIYISEACGIVITGSFDTSIRCWSLATNKCVRIFQGHQGTVTCLSFCEENERLVSGSYDKTCRVWSLKNKLNQRIFKHKYALSAVAVTNEDICITGGYRGSIKVFQISSGKLIKTITRHAGIITGIKFDKWHIITCGTDGYALAFSGQGNHKKCLIAMRHPKPVLCVEFQFLRAITGSADGKIRIWNILNGDCLRVMRGNSQCDPVLSLTVSNNRILINTEFNIILMEFQPVVYEYGSKPELASENIMIKENKNTSVRRAYTNIRAKRMEVVGTPNVKIFNDDRKSVLSHSSGPISTKNLQEAKMIQSPRKSASATTRLSIVTINTPMMFNTPTSNNYNKSSLSYVNVQSEFKLNSIIPSDFYNVNDTNSRVQSRNNTSKNDEIEKKQEIIKDNVGIKLDIEHIDQDEANILRYKKLTLDETKSILRNQLRNMRTNATNLMEHFKNKPNNPKQTITDKNLMDSKSCLETALINRNQNCLDLELKRSKSLTVRPTSSPSYYDTKTMLKITSDEFQPFINLNSNNGDQLISPSMYTVRPKTPDNVQNEVKAKPIVTKSAVTKLFETQNLSLKTNTNMHPLNVSSKLPNPKIVSAVRPKSSFERKMENQSEFRNVFAESESQSAFIHQPNGNETVKVQRTQIENRQPCPLMISQFQKRPPLPKRTTNKSNELIEKFETNQLIGHENLNLMTHKEVDAIVNKISVLFDDSEANKKKEDEKLYKKLWLLKSTGLYHGSLLAKQKSYAPEIRE